MNILVAGLGKGSWEVRGLQLGAAMGGSGDEHADACGLDMG
jgi:hypothetical protein